MCSTLKTRVKTKIAYTCRRCEGGVIHGRFPVLTSAAAEALKCNGKRRKLNRSSFASCIFSDHHGTTIMQLYKKLDWFLTFFWEGKQRTSCVFIWYLTFSWEEVWLYLSFATADFCWGFLFYQTHFCIYLLQTRLLCSCACQKRFVTKFQLPQMSAARLLY